MRIAYVLWIPWKTYRGGGEEYAENLCKHLASKGHDVVLISPPAKMQADIGKTKHLLVSGLEKGFWSIIGSFSKLQIDICRNQHITIRNVALRRMISGLSMALWSLRIPSVLSEVNPEVVISHNIFPPFFCQKWAEKHRKLFINNFLHIEPARKEPILSWRHHLFRLLSLRRGDCICVAISHYQKQLMQSFKKQVYYVGMGYDYHKPLQVHKEKIILYLGKIDKIKQVPLLLGAWKQINHDGWKLILAGDGSDYDYCLNYVKEINLTDYEFLGYVTNEEKWSLYSKAKIFAFPSLYEGFGIVLLEALNEGCIPVVNDLPPMNEIVKLENGFITAPTMNAWAETLSVAMSADLSKKQIQILDRYKWDAVAERLEHVIEMSTQAKRN
jgi:glycosyltransferase involved in cell wall biosynthesis